MNYLQNSTSPLWVPLQPISPSHASSLDHLLAAKVHKYLGFPFWFNTLLLTAPLNFQGFSFPSISTHHINDALAVSGLQHDLNHHITPFHQMASIMLANWTCGLNNCIDPVSHLSPGTTTNTLHNPKIPFSWVLTRKVIKHLNLTFTNTDLHYIMDGSVGIRHLANITNSVFSHQIYIPSCTVTNFERAGYKILCDLGHLSTHLESLPLSFFFNPSPPTHPICMKH